MSEQDLSQPDYLKSVETRTSNSTGYVYAKLPDQIKVEQLEAENERLKEDLKNFAPVQLISGMKPTNCKHSNYWITMSGNCMACIHDELEKKLADEKVCFGIATMTAMEQEQELQSLRTQLEQAKAEGVLMRDGIITYLRTCAPHISECWVNHLMEIGGIDFHPPYDFKPKEALSSPLIEKEVRTREAMNAVVEAASNVTVLTSTDFSKLWASKLNAALDALEKEGGV